MYTDKQQRAVGGKMGHETPFEETGQNEGRDKDLIEDVLRELHEELGEGEPLLEETPRNESMERRGGLDTISDQTNVSTNETVMESPVPPQEGVININEIKQRLERIEKRILSLDSTKPEYVEERTALERKKIFVQNEPESRSKTTGVEPTSPALPTKEDQLKAVEELLNKKTFGYVAPIPGPAEEEDLRLKRAQKAQEIDTVEPLDIVTAAIGTETTDNTGETLPNTETQEDERLRTSSEIRSSFIRELLETSKVSWYENPSRNRDRVNEHVMRIAGLLSGKTPETVDMNDIQTARLFLFNGAPKEVLEHPAYSYVESFYNYQNSRGYSGKNIKGEEAPDTTATESPYMTVQPGKVEENAVQSPFVGMGERKKENIPSPFINLGGIKKDDDTNNFSI